jgi:hypothetical protein
MLDGAARIGGHIVLVAVFQRDAQSLAGVFLVVDDQDGFLHGAGS